MKGKDLKNSILQMAVQGKLVPQDPDDEPASVLLERIREERRRLIAEGKLKAPKGGESVIYRASDGSHYEKRIDAKGHVLSDECIEDEIPFEIPESWEWARLESVCRTIKDGDHQPPPQVSTGIPFLVISDVSTGTIEFNNARFVPFGYYEALDGARKPEKDDLLFTVTGSFGIPIVVRTDDSFCFQRHIALLKPLVSVDYLWLAMQSPSFFTYCDLKATGTAQRTVALTTLRNALLPIPSKVEQTRILSFTSNILPAITQYDALESDRQQLDAELPDRLRKSILQQAVQGRLAPQDPADEPASVLLGRIREERRRLIAEGRLKAPKGGESVIYRASDGSYYEKRVDAKGRGGEPVCIDDEIPFEIPDSWEWVRISSIGEVVGGGTPKTHDASLWGCKEHGIAWVTPADMKHVKGIYVEAGERYISDEGLSSSSARLLPIGSVLMSSRAPIGYVAIASAPIATNQGFKSIVPYIAGMSLWLYWVIQSRMDNIKERATGTTFKEISGNEFGMTLIPLPPCKEQFDICSSIKKLLEIATNQ